MSEYFVLGTKRFVQESTYQIPPGYALYQLRDDYATDGGPRSCSFGGCPAVVDFVDNPPDVFFTKDWQYYLWAINKEMWANNSSAIVSLMGYTKAFMNRTGIDNPEDERRNYLTQSHLDAPKDPATDKFRSMNLNTHLGRDDGTWMYPLALNGTQPPPMKPGRTRPQTLASVNPDDYLIMPWTHPFYFIDCVNVKWKPDTQTLDYGQFANGAVRSYAPYNDGLPHTLFPFVTSFMNVKTPLGWWRKLRPGEPFPSAIRRG